MKGTTRAQKDATKKLQIDARMKKRKKQGGGQVYLL